MTQLPIQLDTRTEDAALPYGADQLSDDAILERAEAILAARCVRDGDVVSSPADARALIRMRTANVSARSVRCGLPQYTTPRARLRGVVSRHD